MGWAWGCRRLPVGSRAPLEGDLCSTRLCPGPGAGSGTPSCCGGNSRPVGLVWGALRAPCVRGAALGAAQTCGVPPELGGLLWGSRGWGPDLQLWGSHFPVGLLWGVPPHLWGVGGSVPTLSVVGSPSPPLQPVLGGCSGKGGISWGIETGRMQEG